MSTPLASPRVRAPLVATPALVLIILTGMGVRGWLLFSTPWVPGINGAYYLVQARALLERGALGLPDMPLLFHLHAALAWLFCHVFGRPMDAAIVFAVKACDACLPPLVAVPVFLLTRRWAEHLGRKPNTVPLCAAALVALSSPLIGMVGDYQKNSLALVWLAGLIAALHAWLERHDGWRGAAVLGCLALLGLTHIGVLGTALLLTGLVGVLWFALGGRLRKTSLAWIAAGGMVLGLAAVLVLWKFDPARIHRLAGAMMNPAQFAGGNPMPMPMGGGGFALLQNLPFALFVLAVAPSLWVVWKYRRTLSPADGALAAGCALTALALAGPWFSFDKLMRFYLIALIPATVAWAFAIMRVATPWRRNLAICVTLVPLLVPTLLTLPAGGRPVLSDAALEELAGLRPLIPAPSRTLVSAQHGVEWWSAWLLHTPISQSGALTPNDWTKFERVLFLEVKSGMQMGGFGGGPRPPGGNAPPMPLHPFPSASGPGGFSGLMAAPIPGDAPVLHSGTYIKLANVLSPPLFVKERKPGENPPGTTP